MQNALRRALRSLARRGRARLLPRLLDESELRLLRKPPRSPAVRRRAVGHELAASLDHRVAHGPFVGFRLGGATVWGDDDAAMLLGLYEQEVVARVASRPAPWDLLINVGAADGFYAVGCLASGVAKRCLAFELDPLAQESLRATAVANGVLDRLEILGAAGEEDLLRIPTEPDTIVLVDIEGQEFDVMTKAVLEHFRAAEIIIEVHDWGSRGADDVDLLVENAREAGFAIEWIHTGPRDPGAIPEIDHLSDDDRWSICSEGRPRPMRWLRLSPQPA